MFRRYGFLVVALLLVACSSAQIPVLQTRVAEMDATVQAVVTPATDDALQADLVALQQQVAVQTDEMATLVAQGEASATKEVAFRDDLTVLQQQVTVQAVLMQTPVAQVATLENKMAALETAVSTPQSTVSQTQILALQPWLYLDIKYLDKNNQLQKNTYPLDQIQIDDGDYEFDLDTDLPIVLARLQGGYEDVLLYSPVALSDLSTMNPNLTWQLYKALGNERVVIDRGPLVSMTRSMMLLSDTDAYATSDDLLNTVQENFDLNEIKVVDILFVDERDEIMRYTLLTYLNEGSPVPGGSLYAQCTNCQSPRWANSYDCLNLIPACQQFYR